MVIMQSHFHIPHVEGFFLERLRYETGTILSSNKYFLLSVVIVVFVVCVIISPSSFNIQA